MDEIFFTSKLVRLKNLTSDRGGNLLFRKIKFNQIMGEGSESLVPHKLVTNCKRPTESDEEYEVHLTTLGCNGIL